MATESPGEAHAGDGVVDLASGDDSDTATDAEGVVGGDTDDEVPEGENYFGRASKEGAAPAGANPFAAASSAPEDDWATQIAEAKAMVEAQRIAREKEEALERAREMAAAELKGKAYEGRRKAGDPAPETNAETTNAGGAKDGAGSAHSRVRKMLKARRPLGSGERSDASATNKNGSSPAPFSFGGGVLAAPNNEPSDAKSEPSPFAGFSLLGDASGAQKKTTPGAVVSAEGDGASKNADRVDFKNPRGGGGVFGRLSGAPAPFEPSSIAEEANDEEDDEEEDEEEDEDDTGVPAVVPLFTNATPEATTKTTPTIPSAATSTAGNRTPLAVELDL